MKKLRLRLRLSLSLLLNLSAQHTFSIVAIDSLTGEIGSAGATCGDEITWPGTGGAVLISDILPGKGAIHTQSYYLASNQANARQRMEEGLAPQEIIDWLESHDSQGNPGIRQYGLVGWHEGEIQAAAFTGSNCLDYKNHLIGPNYAIQGNILLGEEILTNMEQGFLNTTGPLADRLIAAMQGANVAGADTRCLDEGVSSLSAFLRVARPDDEDNQLYLDLNVPSTPQGAEPIDALQEKYDNWKTTGTSGHIDPAQPKVTPQPARDELRLEFPVATKLPEEVLLYNRNGQVVLRRKLRASDQRLRLEVSTLPAGIYFLSDQREGKRTFSRKVVLFYSLTS